MQTFCVMMIGGVGRQGESASIVMGVRGLAFIIAETSARKVESTL